MADDLIKTLDEAAQSLLAKAMASDSMVEAQETFRLVAAWAERRAKLQPVKPDTGGKKFNELRGKLNGPNGRKTVGRGPGAQDEAEDPASLDA